MSAKFRRRSSSLFYFYANAITIDELDIAKNGKPTLVDTDIVDSVEQGASHLVNGFGKNSQDPPTLRRFWWRINKKRLVQPSQRSVHSLGTHHSTVDGFGRINTWTYQHLCLPPSPGGTTDLKVRSTAE
ncbi:hypothetical protein [Absidia glauca]|uniref:Uncharacterized protein n=1 Tax=Absidia glauca TaxID=4829 RepID=A0A168T3H5_ABSGL|nr:hypothetical protein [Absidia glauca]